MVFLFSLLVFFGPIISALLPNITGKVNAVWLIFFLLIFLFYIKIIISRKITGSFNLWLCFTLLFCIVEVMSVSWSPYYFYDSGLMQQLFARYVTPVFVAIIAFNLFNTEKKYSKAIKYLLIAALMLAFFALIQMIFGLQTLFSAWNKYEPYRASATFQNPNGLAIFLVLTIPHLLYGISREIIPKKVGWFSIAMIIVGIICTVSRKGIITAWLVLFLYFTLNKEAKKIFVLSIATVVAVAILSLTTLVSQRFTEEKIGSQFAGKQVLVSAGVDMFLKNPILGLGYQGYAENYNKYFKRRYISEPKKYDAHNMYITVLVNYGLLGFFTLMAIFIYPLYISVRTLKKGSLKYSKDISILCIVSIVPFMMNTYYAGGILESWPIIMMFYTNVIVLFSLTSNRQHV